MEKKTVNREYYIGLFEDLKAEVVKKRPQRTKKHQDNGPCDKLLGTMAKIP